MSGCLRDSFFLLSQRMPSSTSIPLLMNSSSASSLILTRVTNQPLECSIVSFVVSKQSTRWKIELQSCGLNYKLNKSFHRPSESAHFGDRRDITCCGMSDGFGEPFGDVADKTSSQDGKLCSSVGSSLKDGKVPTISSSAEVTSNPSRVSPCQASAIKMDSCTSRIGVLITAGHFLLAAASLVLMDYHLLKANPPHIVPFRLILPFVLSAGVTAVLGYFFVPVLRYFKAAQVFRIEGPTSHQAKSGTPTMGGLFFVPVGVAVAGCFTGFNSSEVQIAMMATLTFAGIGLLDDGLAFWRRHNYGLPGEIKLMLEVAVGTIFFFWLESTKLSYPHKIRHVVWLPAPFGLVHPGKWCLPLSAVCYVAMGNGVNLTDGLDGLAGGTAAVALIAMSFAVVTLLPALGVFGSSMAGACFGFLVHNRFKAKVFMGDTGSLALGGALASMACCTGMFFPLFIASGVFVIETISVLVQVIVFKLTKQMYGEGHRLLKMAPFHHHLELSGWKEPIIIMMAYSLSVALEIVVAYLVLGNEIKVSIK